MASSNSTTTSTTTTTNNDTNFNSDSESHSESNSDDDDNSSNSSTFDDIDVLTLFTDFHELTIALEDEVQKACVLNNCPPPACNLQIHLLDEWKLEHPHLFQCKLHVPFGVFVEIVDKIQGHDVFRNNSHLPQLLVSTQLAIFLNAAGYYGNAATSQDMEEWAGVSVGTVYNCYKRVMTAILSLHNNYIYFNLTNPQDQEDKMKTQTYIC